MKTKRVKNLLSEARALSYGGKRIAFGPAGSPTCELILPEKAADYVMELLGDTVLELHGEARTESFVNQVVKKTHWLANMTGDPDAAQQVLAGMKRDKRTGQEEPQYERNEKCDPSILTEYLGAVDSIFQDGTGGKWGRTTPARRYSIQPFTRVEVEPAIGASFINRDNARPAHQRGKVILSRAPTDFEPTNKDEWKLDELRAYLKLIEPNHEGKLGPSEVELAGQHQDEEDLFLAIEEAKDLVWRRCILRVFNPKYTLPSRAEFERYMARETKKSEKVSADEAKKLVKNARP